MTFRDGGDDKDPSQSDILDHRSIRLANVSRPRRRLIGHLAEQPEKNHSVSALAEALLPEEDKPDLLSAFELQLHHVHLPALNEDGLVEYDAGARQVVSVKSNALIAAMKHLNSEDEDIESGG